jgi:uncharacterized protein
VSDSFPASLGIDKYTGAPITDFDHVRQCLGTLFSTRIGQRIMRRTYGAQLLGLLGKELTPDVLMRAYMAVVIAVYLWEPRFAVTSASYPGTTPQGMALGQLGIKLNGDYRPNALTGDFTVADTVSVVI